MFKHPCQYRRYAPKDARIQWSSRVISRGWETNKEAVALDNFILVLYKLDLADKRWGPTAVRHTCNYCGYVTWTGQE